MPPAHMVRFRRNAEKTGMFHRREWCSDIPSISAKTYCVTGAMNGSPTVRTKRI